MSERIPANLVQLVRERAGEVCEYCLLPQSSQEATFHVDHIRPRADQGPTIADNLALACVTCSLRKSARTWRLIGRTPIGRATIRALGMNRPAIIVIRQTLAALGRFPPQQKE